MKISIEKQAPATSSSARISTGTGSRSLGGKKRVKLSVKKKIRFYRELLSLQSSGIDIYTSLDLMRQSEESRKRSYTELVERIQKRVEQGDSLADAMRKAAPFSTFETASVQAAELSGTLTEVLEEILKYYEYSARIKRMLFGSLSYPIMLIVVAFVIVFFMLQFVVPMFKDIYTQMGKELPSITVFLMSISDFMTNYSLVVLGFIGALVGTGFLLSRNPRVVVFLEKVLVRIPFVGPYYLTSLKSRVCSMFHFLLRAHVPLNDCLSHLAESSSSPYFSGLFKEGIAKLEAGETLHDILKPMGMFKASEVMLIQLGEETNKLSVTFGNISEQLNAELEYRSGLLNKFLEPLLISLIALFIGVILIALYMPLFNLSFDT